MCIAIIYLYMYYVHAKLANQDYHRVVKIIPCLIIRP